MENRIVTPVQIVETSGILGGKPRIDGRRISVAHIVWHVVHQAWSFDQMNTAFHLRPAEIHAALAYYADHKAEIEQTLQDEYQEDEEEDRPYEETLHLLTTLHSIGEVASALAIEEQVIQRWIDAQLLPAHWVGGRWRIDLTHARQLYNTHKE